MAEIWIVDDDPAIRFIIEDSLQAWGHRCRCFADAKTALAALAQESPALMISDLRMRGMDGLQLLEKTHALHPQLPFIITTAYADIDNTVHAYRQGVFDYLPKPFDLDELKRLVGQALRAATGRSRRDNAPAPASPAQEIVGQSPAMQQLYRAIGRLSNTRVNILISGETGTGKELFARALHTHSPASEGPFIALNMAAIPPELAESELFGHEKGAFTGADSQRRGRFAQADQGSLFLDEVGDMPLALQAKLLRALADGSYYPVGGQQVQHAHARIIAASHKDLAAEVALGNFREDLYHRLNVIHLHLPPLRQRREDIPALLHYHLYKAAQTHGLSPKRLDESALQQLCRYDWPGNIRELENLCQQLTIMSPVANISAADLPPLAKPMAQGREEDWQRLLDEAVHQALRQGQNQLYHSFQQAFDQTLFDAALEHSGGHKQKAAQLLGIGRNTLSRKRQDQAKD